MHLLKLIKGQIKGAFLLLLYGLNTIIWCTPLFIIALFKALAPVKTWRQGSRRVLNAIVENWVGVNNLNQKWISKIHWDIKGLESLKRSDWYLVLSNHQSWVDILVLQKIFNRKIPFLTFFIKKELFWFPIIGQAWWALDFPFIKRYKKSLIKRKPHLKGKDLEITRKACEKFKQIPVSVMNFVEGTRYTKEKHHRQHSPYTHLLKPKAGGIAYVLGSMGDHLNRILDVTIVYPGKMHSFWALLCGRIEEIKVNVRSLSIDPELLGDYVHDASFRKGLQKWLNTVWTEKDRQIDQMIRSSYISGFNSG